MNDAAWIVFGLLLLLSIRHCWLAWKINRYLFLVSYWGLATKPGVIAVDEASQLWPSRIMTMEVWRWDFSRYVVYSEHHDEIWAWAHQQCQRRDLTWAKMIEETQGTVEGEDLPNVQDDQPPAPGSQP